jgi:hypothetical protein
MTAPDEEGDDDDVTAAEATALLGEIREPPPASAEVRARAFARLAATLPIGGSDPGSSSGNAGSGGPGAASGAAHAGGAIGKALAARVPAWSLVASFVAGGAVAASIVSRAPSPGASPSASTSTVVDVAPGPSSDPALASPSIAAPSASAPSAPSSASPSASVASASTTRPTARGSGGEPPSARSADASLEQERSLLDVARTAVGRGDGASALRAAEVHAKRFPRGVLAEEREAMIIQALRLLHRDDEARARLDRFRGRFPTSLLRPALEADDGGAH